ncbi:cytochrome C oxidase subunit IV family protein [Candidatus Saccharibacteria bacterium]|nr:cytochrome C oxidase subunit IV family protein [Candidatus Saccharibacteria bacterium]
MSTESHVTKSNTKSEHGTTGSYVIGFILSLVFTIIPYYLVVNKVIAGNALLAVILSIAILQMAIQLLFFLHLGRGPKPLYNVVFFFATAGVIVLTISASLFIMSHLYQNMSPEEITTRLAQKEGISQLGGEKTGACKELGDNHIITIKDGQVSPIHLEASLCDTLTFINEDNKKRVMKFGSHTAQVSYGGEYEVVLDDGRPETITLNQSGDFAFHDDQDINTDGHFSVAP